MKLPQNNKKLDVIFQTATMPTLSEFRGDYVVEMLTGLPSLRKFSHRKIFYTDGHRVVGHNMLFTKKCWGYFFLELGVCKKLNLPVVIINYDKIKNSFVTSRIRDYVRCVEKDKLYLGRFNYFFMGKSRFLGYFSLSRIN